MSIVVEVPVSVTAFSVIAPAIVIASVTVVPVTLTPVAAVATLAMALWYKVTAPSFWQRIADSSSLNSLSCGPPLINKLHNSTYLLRLWWPGAVPWALPRLPAFPL